MINMTTRTEVEEWIKKAPKCIKLEIPINVDVNRQPIFQIGRSTPSFVNDGYSGSINFKCKNWDE